MINCIYIHIPFCKTKCPYCSFCSFNLIKYKDEYINALIKEIKYYYKNNPVKTIYFGGGTPSLLDTYDIEKILECFNCNHTTSITLEANPLDLTKEKLTEYKKLGINRISIGAQSFNDDILKTIRQHLKKDILQAIYNTKEAGFDNINIDLIYGLPSQTTQIWQETLDEAIKTDIKHISLYGLKIDKGTKYYKTPPQNLPGEDMQSQMYKKAIEILSDKFEHYEFSNFAYNKNYISTHNMAYWKRENYFGFGLSASGFINDKRYTNTFNFKEYINNPINKIFESLTFQQQIEEEMFLGLRLSEGIDFEYINKKYDIDIYQKYKNIFDKYTGYGLIKKTKKGVKLTLQGILLSNEILCEFIEI